MHFVSSYNSSSPFFSKPNDTRSRNTLIPSFHIVPPLPLPPLSQSSQPPNMEFRLAPLLLLITLPSLIPSTQSNPAATSTEPKLTPDYYSKTCPQFQRIIQTIVTDKQLASPTTAAAALRLFFHDCVVEGCDASILILTNAFNQAERDAEINLSLPGDGFDVVVRAKTALELECPGIVSCADILAATARNLVSMVGGPLIPIAFGRKDGSVSHAAAAQEGGHLGRSNMSVSELISIFNKTGFTVQEMVALSGAHTIGFSHCKEFSNRIFNFSKDSEYDPTYNPKYAEGLRKLCAKSDQGLVMDDRTKHLVDLYAANQTAFFQDFAKAMQKASMYKIKTGNEGEVRLRCDAFNTIKT